MSLKKLWLAPLVLVWGAAYASPDTLIMEDGRRIRGEIVSMSRGVIVFDQDDGALTRTRRIRVNEQDVRRINLRDNDDFDDRGSVYRDDSDVYTGGYGSGFGQDIMVRADRSWTDTGLTVRAGDVFRIDASGYINWGPNRSDDPNGEYSSPYNANRPLPNRAGGALIGRIGNGQPFFVGSGTQSFRAANSGRLYLGINDDYLQDNSGSFRVMISR
jgi:hypothetical protein